MRPLDLAPRRRPAQARSQSTVAAIREAALQVLVARGHQRLTTTLVAERAGVSVGTLYQYYPHRDALLAELVQAHLDESVQGFGAACAALDGKTLAQISTGLAASLVQAKCGRLAVSRSLRGPLVELGFIDDGVVRASARASAFVSEVLRRCADASFDAPAEVASVLVASCRSALQPVVAHEGGISAMPVRVAQVRSLVTAYLREASTSSGC